MMTVRRRFIAGLGTALIMLGLAPATPAGQTVELTIDTGGRAADGLDEVLATAVDFLHGKGQRLGHCAAGPDGNGTRSPGWLDVSDGNDWGVTAVFPDDVMSAAPKGITFDAESGVLTVSLQPSQSLPRRVAVGDPPLKAHFRLEFHTTRIPTRYEPELTDAQYRRLLESVKDHWCFYGNIMVYAGLRPDLPKDGWIQRLIEADMQPSALLRTYEPYLPAALERLGKDFAPSSNKEDNIRRLLHFYRTGEILPPPSPIVPGPGNARK